MEGSVTHDPRATPELPARDYEGLAFVGRGWEVAQYQLREAVFPGLSEVVASRRVRRWAALKLVRVERWMGMGMNLLRLTPAGRNLVVAAGAAKEEELFTPDRSVALKDLKHLLFVNDVRTLALRGIPMPVDLVRPAWALQRELQPPPAAIPDLLLVARRTAHRRGRQLAVEIDLGGERLVATFLPKLRLLAEVLTGWADGAATGILILTRGSRRAVALRAGVGDLGLDMSVLVQELPSASGVEALRCLEKLLSPPVSASAQAEGG